MASFDWCACRKTVWYPDTRCYVAEDPSDWYYENPREDQIDANFEVPGCNCENRADLACYSLYACNMKNCGNRGYETQEQLQDQKEKRVRRGAEQIKGGLDVRGSEPSGTCCFDVKTKYHSDSLPFEYYNELPKASYDGLVEIHNQLMRCIKKYDIPFGAALLYLQQMRDDSK